MKDDTRGGDRDPRRLPQKTPWGALVGLTFVRGKKKKKTGSKKKKERETFRSTWRPKRAENSRVAQDRCAVESQWQRIQKRR